MLTRRGWSVTAIALAAVAMAATFTPRALNAVVAPALVALLAAAIQAWRFDRPALSVDAPNHGFRGEQVAVTLRFDADEPLGARVALDAGDGLVVADRAVETTIPGDSIRFDVRLTRRGQGRVGPVRVVAEDVLGLWRRTFTYPATADLLVFPRVRRLDAGFARGLHDAERASRTDFEYLREYERGDSLRDVHWKSSAKRADDFLVKEFTADERSRHVDVVVQADERVEDATEAAASVVSHLLDAGLAVGLVASDGRVPPGAGEAHRTRLLALLARTSAGRVSGRLGADADVTVRATATAILVGVDGHEWQFERLARDAGDRTRAAAPVEVSDAR